MSNFQTKVIAGNVVFHPNVIREFLAKSHYFLTYKPDEEKAELWVNHGAGGKLLLEIRQFPYESAAKLAEGLGLKGDRTETPLSWSKYNPVLHLEHDGGPDAETLRMEMLRLGIPHTVWRGNRFCLNTGGFLYMPPMWTIPQMLDVIRDIFKQTSDLLATKP